MIISILILVFAIIALIEYLNLNPFNELRTAICALSGFLMFALCMAMLWAQFITFDKLGDCKKEKIELEVMMKYYDSMTIAEKKEFEIKVNLHNSNAEINNNLIWMWYIADRSEYKVDWSVEE